MNTVIAPIIRNDPIASATISSISVMPALRRSVAIPFVPLNMVRALKRPAAES
jgi:hypothetical protein